MKLYGNKSKQNILGSDQGRPDAKYGVLLYLKVPCISVVKLFQHFCRARFQVKVIQLCQTLCNPMDYSPPGSFVHEILQAGILEWVVIPFSR